MFLTPLSALGARVSEELPSTEFLGKVTQVMSSDHSDTLQIVLVFALLGIAFLLVDKVLPSGSSRKMHPFLDAVLSRAVSGTQAPGAVFPRKAEKAIRNDFFAGNTQAVLERWREASASCAAGPCSLEVLRMVAQSAPTLEALEDVARYAARFPGAFDASATHTLLLRALVAACPQHTREGDALFRQILPSTPTEHTYEQLLLGYAAATHTAKLRQAIAELPGQYVHVAWRTGVAYAMSKAFVRQGDLQGGLAVAEALEGLAVAAGEGAAMPSTFLADFLAALLAGFLRTKQTELGLELFCTRRADIAKAKLDVVTYSQLIKAHCDAREMEGALDLFEEMLQTGCRPDAHVFTHLIDGCCRIANPDLAEKLFHDMRATGTPPTIYAIVALVKVYGRCGLCQKAKDLVDSMEELYGVSPTVVVYTCLISSLVRQKKIRAAYVVFCKMEETLTPDAKATEVLAQGLAEAGMLAELGQVLRRSDERGIRVDVNKRRAWRASCGMRNIAP